ncbi:VWA domain-containing protein [Paucibacter sp. TC2R-5]|uniref:vWA domain-containing protein n=1 Tax=Paucibacter sp. TC2R-5 TaxID=2893555 RepID=UPI0021E386F8|nr:VWA domain-containing protein [Paucibacter sp. TC2R-5]MCV2358257.1 VWA domain-containing protein [Paucibacter sp. TC2R-5]
MADHLAENVMHFARVLREAGMAVGSDRVLLSLQALELAGLASRRDLHATLSACLLDRAEHRALFDQAFHIFWRDPDLLGRVMRMLLPQAQAKSGLPALPENRRLVQALFPHAPKQQAQAAEPEQQLDIDAHLSWSEREQLRQRDFDTMTSEEWLMAKRLLGQMGALLPPSPTRRWQGAAGGRLDWRASLRAQARSESLALLRQKPRQTVAPLLILADISGSMSRYSRMLLHLAHGLTNPQSQRSSKHTNHRGSPRIHSFVFGTRLTPISRLLKQRDPDLAVAAVARQVQDWSGGTRISACLHAFNQHWARRVLSSQSIVLLITDGLEQGSDSDPQCRRLAFEAQRLRLSCRQLIWLNPLLRFEGFEPKAAGVRALLPEVTRHLPVHNLASLQDLMAILSHTEAQR